MAETVNNSDSTEEISFNLSISDSENELEQQTLVAGCSSGVQPYMFEPECSSSDENGSSSDRANNEEDGEGSRIDDISW